MKCWLALVGKIVCTETRGGTGAWNYTLTGGLGNDVFVFQAGFGKNQVTDFNVASKVERIDLSEITQIVSFADLVSNHLSQEGDNAVIRVLGGTLVLLSVSTFELPAGDFVF